jgi:hypothetical protein
MRDELTPMQLEILLVLARDGGDMPSMKLCSLLSTATAQKGFFQRREALKKRGYLLSYWQGRNHFWRLGPVSDRLKEDGILPMENS